MTKKYFTILLSYSVIFLNVVNITNCNNNNNNNNNIFLTTTITSFIRIAQNKTMHKI